MIFEKGNVKDMDKLCQFLDAHYGCIDEKDEDKF